MALQSGNPDEVAEAQQSWQDAAAHFWNQCADDEGGTPKNIKKACRVKVYEWLAATDHSLVVGTGQGWSQFLVPEGAPPEEWRCAVITCDQGGRLSIGGLVVAQKSGISGMLAFRVILQAGRT